MEAEKEQIYKRKITAYEHRIETLLKIVDKQNDVLKSGEQIKALQHDLIQKYKQSILSMRKTLRLCAWVFLASATCQMLYFIFR